QDPPRDRRLRADDRLRRRSRLGGGQGRSRRAAQQARQPRLMARGPASGRGVVVEINVAPRNEELPDPESRVDAVAARGLEGDRYFAAEARVEAERDRDITLIAAEALEALFAETGIELSAAASRRNVLTRGIDLNALVGRGFRVGEVEC